MKSHRETCPKCSHTRSRGRTIKCLTVFESGNKYCHHCGYDSAKEDGNAETARTYTKPCQKLPESTTSGEFREIYKSRKITDEVIKRNKVSWNGKEIMFPYMLREEVVNIKYRGRDKKFRQEANAMKIFYGLNDIIGEKDVIIVEGEWDKLACEVAGFENVVSVPDGAPTPNTETYTTKFQFIDDWAHLFDDAERIIIAVDSDAPGKKLETELIRRFGPERSWLVRWPDGCKDANQVLIEHGMLGLLASLENPTQIPIEGVFTVEDYMDDLISLYMNGLQGGAKTGWGNVDEFYSVRPGEMTIVTGIPSHGKSSWLTALQVSLSEQFGWRFGVFTPENQPMQRYIATITAIHKGKPFKAGATARMTVEEMKESAKWIDGHFYFIQPDDNSLKVMDMLKKAKEMVKRYGINGLVLDPWNEIDHTRPAGMTETEYISLSLTQIRRFARLYQCHTWIVAHPQKMIKDKEGAYPPPTAYDISGSAHWYNKGDCIVCVYRHVKEEEKPVEIHVQKVRFREVGRVGTADLVHDVTTGRYKVSGHFEKNYSS